MFSVSAPRYTPHRRQCGAFFSFPFALVLLVSCQTAQQTELPSIAPTVGIVHYDVALAIGFEASPAVRSEIYAHVAAGLAEEGALDLAIGILDHLERQFSNDTDGDAEVAINIAYGWSRVASAEDEYVVDAFRADERVLELVPSLDRPEETASYLLQLLAVQLGNENRSIESVRASIDEFYLLPDDEVRAAALVNAAELIRSSGERTALTAIVQQAIAVLPVIETPFLASTLSARLADLSETIGRARDARTLLDEAVQRAEVGLFVTDEDLHDLALLISILAEFDSEEAAAIVVENVTPRAFRALAYAELGAVAASEESAERFFSLALERAMEIADPERRARTVSAVILRRSEADSMWSPESAAAEMLQSVDFAVETSSAARLEVLTGLGTAYFLADRGDGFDRLRGLIASSGELAALIVATAEELYRRGRVEQSVVLLDRIEPTPETLIGFTTAPAVSTAELHRALGNFDRAVQLIASAFAGEVLPIEDVAIVLSRIPADYRPDPAVVAQLQRIELP